jgi:hypothetical protein
MRRSVELGLEGNWKRADWRSQRAIPLDVPCLGILCDGDATKHTKFISALPQVIQELKWNVPGLCLACLAIQGEQGTAACPSVHSLGLHPGTLQIFDGEDPFVALEWLCGMDAWLLTSRSAYARAFETIATELRTLSIGPSTAWDCESRSLASILLPSLLMPQRGGLRNTYRMPRAGMTVDAALEILTLARTDATSEPSNPFVSSDAMVRSAA